MLKPHLEAYRTKSGPNGHALNCAISDARCLPPNLVHSLSIMGGPKMEYILKKVMQSDLLLDGFVSKFFRVSKGESFRRLSSFPDKEGKVRVIGILDWYSQITLKPLHNYLGNCLKKIRQDCTFDQSNFTKSLKGSKVYYSVDLSNATDRFPIVFIELLLKAQLPSAYVDAWRDVMVGYPFDFKGSKFIYSTGNPMGAYSSFNSFALAHHYIIYHICRELGKN